MNKLKYWHNGYEYIEDPNEVVPPTVKYLIENNLIWVDYPDGFTEYAVTCDGVPGITMEVLYDDDFLDENGIDRKETLKMMNAITDKLKEATGKYFPECKVFREDSIDEYFDCWVKLFIPFNYGEEKSVKLGKLFARIVNEEEANLINEFKITDPEIELATIQDIESVLEAKIEWYKKNEPQARREIDDMETALRVVSDLCYDLD